MIAFTWQTLLLLALAYGLGCWISCLARRMIGTSAVRSDSPTMVPAGAIASAAAAGAAARQTVPASYTPRPITPVAPPAPVRDAFRRADTLEPAPGSEASRRAPSAALRAQPSPGPSVDPVSRFERALAGPHASPAPPPQQTRAAATGATAAAPSAGTQRSSEGLRLPAGRPADDLKRIRSIDQPLEVTLHRLGIRTFAEIGAWKPADVARISHALGFQGRIEQENWIEQAQILASGKDTHYSSLLTKDVASRATDTRPDTAPVVQTRAPAAQTVAAVATVATAVPATPAVTPRMPPAPRPVEAVRAERISVEAASAAAAAMAAAAAAASRPYKADETTGAPLSQFSKDPSPAVEPRGPAAGSAAIAALPAANTAQEARPAVAARDVLQRIGGVTPEIERLLYAQGVFRYDQIAQWTENDVERFDRLLGHQGRIKRENWVQQAQNLTRGGETPNPRVLDRGGADADVSKPTPPVTRVQAPSQPMPSTRVLGEPVERPSTSDAAVTAVKLDAAGASTGIGGAPSGTAVSAAASAAVAALAAVRPVAPAAASPIAAAPALVEATVVSELQKSGDLSSLRSVRSEALRPIGASPFASRPGEAHDLKRIRGIGVLIEKKLNQMGVTTYEQIAEWTVADIERVSHVLDFKGRIERENWVEQARILASGGQTEFSRRADRGENGGM